MKIVSRIEWGARLPKSPPATVPIGSRTAVCVHHDGPAPITVRTLADAYDRMRRDQNYHMDSNGWADIGYNYLVISAPGTPVDGLILTGRGRDAVGAHCLNHNTEWIGVQVAIGGDQTPSPAALASVRWLHDTFETDAGHGLAKVGHSDGFATACPGPILLAWAHAGMPLGAGSPIPVTVPTTPKKPQSVPVSGRPPQIAVDGLLGQGTIRRLQVWAGVTADGHLGPVSWRAIQAKVGANQDGTPGPKTWAAIQRLVGSSPADGVLGPNTVRALQQYLNTH